MPYTGFSTRHNRGRPSAPLTSSSSRAAHGSKLPRSPIGASLCPVISDAARAANTRREVGRIVAQKIRRTSDRPDGTSDRSIMDQLPLA
eukprot:3187165-Pleurochrysis_carterae.AAC.2